MATIDDYRTGKIVEGIGKAESMLDSRSAIADGDSAFDHFREKILAFKPVWIGSEQAAGLIRQAEVVAIGERVCRALHPESPETWTVFLDALAEAMSESGKAEIVTVAEAEAIIGRQSRHRFMASMVSGRYLEICPTFPPSCIFCKAQQAGISCIGLFQDSRI